MNLTHGRHTLGTKVMFAIVKPIKLTAQLFIKTNQTILHAITKLFKLLYVIISEYLKYEVLAVLKIARYAVILNQLLSIIQRRYNNAVGLLEYVQKLDQIILQPLEPCIQNGHVEIINPNLVQLTRKLAQLILA